MDWVWQRVPGNDRLVNILNTRMRSLEAYLSDFSLDDLYYTEAEVDTLLAGKSNTGHTHTESEITDLGNYSLATHLHDDRYYTETEVNSLLAGKSDDGHLHDDRYYTETEVDSLLAGKSDTGHTHDTRYYTETEVNTLLSGKSDTGHTHTESEITDLGNYSVVGHGHVISDITDLVSTTPAARDVFVYDAVDARYENRALVEADISDLGNYSVVGHLHDDRYYTETEVNSLLSGKSDTGHTHVEADITDLGNYAVVGHTHTESDITDLKSYALAGHTHDLSDIVDLVSTTPANRDVLVYSTTTAQYENRPLVEADISDLGVYAPSNHTHDTRYYTETEVDTLLAGKSDTVHTHGLSDITDLVSTTPAARHVLVYDDVDSRYENRLLVEADISDLGNYALTTHNHDALYSPLGHNHDTRYYTETEVNTLLSGKSDTGHTHTEADITDLGNYSVVGHGHVEADITDLKNYALVGHTHDLADIVDLVSTTPANRDVLVYSTTTSQYENRALTEADISDLGLYSPLGHTHDTRYYTETEVNTLLSGKSDTGHTHTEADITDLGNYAVVGHTHVEADITDLKNYALVGHTHDLSDIVDLVSTTPGARDVLVYSTATAQYENRLLVEADISDLGNYSVVGHNHDALYSPLGHTHDTRYYTETEVNTLLSGKSDTGHAHTEADITDLGNYSVVGHTHTEADITDLKSYALAGHTHGLADIVDLVSTTPAARHVLVYNGVSAQYENRLLVEADISDFGTYSPSSHNHDGDYAPLTHNHDTRYYTETEVDSLLSGKSDTGHTHVEADITDLGNYALASHNHTVGSLSDTSVSAVTDGEVLVWTAAAWVSNTLAEAGIAAAGHLHDDRYYTETEVDSLLSNKSDDGHTHTNIAINDLSDVLIQTVASGEVLMWDGLSWINQTLVEAGIAESGHLHDGRYYTETEVNTLLAGKSDTGHAHVEADITDLDHYTSLDFDTDFSGKSTSDLSEGTNLYYTNARADARIAAASLGDLSNITITTIAADEILVWSGTAWINQTLAEAGISTDPHSHTLASLTDVTGTPTDGDVLTYDTVNGWQPEAPSSAGSLATLTDTTITSVAAGEVLKWDGVNWINQTLAEAGIAADDHTHTSISNAITITGELTLDGDLDFTGIQTIKKDGGTVMYLDGTRVIFYDDIQSSGRVGLGSLGYPFGTAYIDSIIDPDYTAFSYRPVKHSTAAPSGAATTGAIWLRY